MGIRNETFWLTSLGMETSKAFLFLCTHLQCLPQSFPTFFSTPTPSNSEGMQVRTHTQTSLLCWKGNKTKESSWNRTKKEEIKSKKGDSNGLIETALKKKYIDRKKMQRGVGREVDVMIRSFKRIRKTWHIRKGWVRKKINI